MCRPSFRILGAIALAYALTSAAARGARQSDEPSVTDAAVLTAVLDHFCDQKEASELRPRNATRRLVLLHKESSGSSKLYLSDSQLASDLTGAEWTVPEELWDSLRERNVKAVSLRGLNFGMSVA